MRISSMMSVAVAAAAFGAMSAAQAGIQVGGTRLVFDAKSDKAEVTLPVRNKGETPYVVQTFVDDGAGGTKTPFVVSPPLVRLESGAEQVIKVRHVVREDVAKLPQDRESVYWLDVKEIPPADKSAASKNTLKIAVLTRVKLFYRPAGLTGSAADAPSQLKWSVVPNPSGQGEALKVHNPTPYHVTFSKIDIAGPRAESINVDMVNPKSDLVIPVKSVKSGSVQFSYTTINDFGAVTPATQVTAQPAQAGAAADSAPKP